MASTSAQRKRRNSSPTAVESPTAGDTTVTFTDDELLALYTALVRAGAEVRPGAGAINSGLTPPRVIRHAAAVDSARRRVAYALAESVGV